MQCTLTALPVSVAESVAYVIVFNWFTYTSCHTNAMYVAMHGQLLTYCGMQSRCRKVIQTFGTYTLQNTTVMAPGLGSNISIIIIITTCTKLEGWGVYIR